MFFFSSRKIWKRTTSVAKRLYDENYIGGSGAIAIIYQLFVKK